MKLVKAGNTIAGYRSGDGANWTQVGSVDISMPSATVAVGLAVTSDNDGTICQANFDNVSIANTSDVAPTPPTGVTATAVSSSQIDLRWTDTSLNETAFRIWRSADGANYWPLVDLPRDTTTFSDSNLPASTRFWYYVGALNTAGTSVAPPRRCGHLSGRRRWTYIWLAGSGHRRW